MSKRALLKVAPVAIGALFLAVILSGPAAGAGKIAKPPANAKFDYQIGDPYKPGKGVRVVSRDWFDGKPIDHGYSICYVNAFQTQDNYPGVNRPDERGNWPKRLVLRRLGDDPHWGGEYLIDLSSKSKRKQAAGWVKQMLARCKGKGYDAVEFDNLDSWTRFDGTPLASDVPFGRKQAVDYARRLTSLTHARGMAAGQKNTVQLKRSEARKRIGFDFAISEECARYSECGGYRKLYGNRVFDIEYRKRDFRKACRTIGSKISVVRRDLLVRPPSSPKYRYGAC